MRVFVDGPRVFMDDGNKVAVFTPGAGGVVPVGAVPESAVRVRLERPRVSPAEKWANKIVDLVAEKHIQTMKEGRAAVPHEVEEWRDFRPKYVAAMKKVLVEEYDPAPPKRYAKDLDELRRIAGGGQVAFVDGEGDLCVWRDGESVWWVQGIAADDPRDILYPVEIVRVVKSESQEG